MYELKGVIGVSLSPRRLPLTLGLSACIVVTLQLVAGLGGPARGSFIEHWVYNAIPVCAAGACLAAAWRRSDRTAWIWIALGILLWGAGNDWYVFVLEKKTEIPFPSLADAGFLGFYVPAYIGVGLLVRSQVVGFVRSLWLDGLIAGFTVAAIGASVVFEVVYRSLGPNTGLHAAVATNLAYPLGDLLLIAIVIGLAGLNGWRLSRSWLLVAGGFLLFGITDSVYLLRVATNSYSYGTILDLGWPASMILLAAAATLTPKRVRGASLEGTRLLVVPSLFASIDLTIVLSERWIHLNPLATSFAGLGLALVIARMWLTFGEYLKVLRSTREQAVTDALTGLGNRRALAGDLEAAALGEQPHVLMLFDLNGFKTYNDRFGHPAGDTLLARLGERFSSCVEERGSAYRLGGDEFCAIVPGTEADVAELRELTVSSLTAKGEGFHVAPSVGTVLLPLETSDATEALRIVDRRMYQEKESARLPGAEGAGVLLAVIEARDPQLATHTGFVTELTLTIGDQLGMGHGALSQLRLVAELHDIGKVAIPDVILDKPGPLSEEEWVLVRQHPLIGERIAARAPGLEAVGRAIRATHERWDGTGYPDGLAADAIPLSARIVAVADAYEAMTSGDRPYRAPRGHADAIEEILACAGTQFDPDVVRAFRRATAARNELPLASGA